MARGDKSSSISAFLLNFDFWYLLAFVTGCTTSRSLGYTWSSSETCLDFLRGFCSFLSSTDFISTSEPRPVEPSFDVSFFVFLGSALEGFTVTGRAVVFLVVQDSVTKGRASGNFLMHFCEDLAACCDCSYSFYSLSSKKHSYSSSACSTFVDFVWKSNPFFVVVEAVNIYTLRWSKSIWIMNDCFSRWCSDSDC